MENILALSARRPSFHNNVVGSKWLCCYRFLSRRAAGAALRVCVWVVISAGKDDSPMSECQIWILQCENVEGAATPKD